MFVGLGKLPECHRDPAVASTLHNKQVIVGIRYRIIADKIQFTRR